jgi:carotenoid cleavage dioxygenase-like enzyme
VSIRVTEHDGLTRRGPCGGQALFIGAAQAPTVSRSQAGAGSCSRWRGQAIISTSGGISNGASTMRSGSCCAKCAARRRCNQIGEMPFIDPRFAMQRARHFWFGTHNPTLGPTLEWGPKGPPFTCLGHYDEAADRLNFWYAGPQSAPEEPCFVPRSANAPEGDGWLLAMVGRRAENRTDLVVLDALHPERGPLAVVKFPCRVHEGFHGTWVSARALCG